MRQTHCERIPSAQTWEPFSTSAILSALTDLLADQNGYRKIQLIWEINPRIIVIPIRKRFSVRHVSIDVPPYISNVFWYTKKSAYQTAIHIPCSIKKENYFSFSENDLANQSTKTGTTYVYLEVYSKVFTTSQIEAGNVSTCYEKDTYFLEGYASLGSRFQKNVVTTVEVRFQIWECELTAWCFRMIPPWWSHLQTH